jgi:MFS family permease
MDCVMTFFGSSANDAALNAWVTDNTDTTNRGRVEGVLSTLPLLATLVVTGGMGVFIGVDNNYTRLFYIIGGAVTVCGLIGVFTIKDSPQLRPNKEQHFLQNIAFGFKPSTVKAHPRFYLVLLAVLIYSVGFQVFFPYLIIYMEHYLGFDALQYSALFGGLILVSSVCSVFLGRLADRIDRVRLLGLAAALFCLGLLAIYCVTFAPRANWFLLMIPAGFLMLAGYLLLLTLLNALVRDYTPPGDAGKIQGVRMFFFVLLPMWIGPAIGDAINQRQALADPARFTYLDTATDTVANVPAPEIFLAAAIVSLLLYVPIAVLSRMNRKK